MEKLALIVVWIGAFALVAAGVIAGVLAYLTGWGSGPVMMLVAYGALAFVGGSVLTRL